MAASSCVKVSISLFVCLVYFTVNVEPARRLITYFNPGCEDRDCKGGLAYIKARGDKDTLHYLITSVGLPMALVIKTKTAETNKDNEIVIDWDKFLSKNLTQRANSIQVDKSLDVLYSYGVIFTKLYQYNDTSDNADVSQYNVNNTKFEIYDFNDFTWEDLEQQSSDYQISLNALDSSTENTQKIANGSLNFKFHFFGDSGRASDLPHLEYNEDTSQLDFTLSNINTLNSTVARFALEAVLLSSDTKGTMGIDESKSLDDEYTPGVFKINNWLTRPNDQPNGGYLQWKPVCYQNTPRTRDVATFVRHYSVKEVNKDLRQAMQQSLAYAFYGEKLDTSLMSSTNFSFGLKKDGTFTSTNYTSWTASLGYGTPPIDTVSTLVVVVISVGLGIPVIIILFGGVVLFWKRRAATKKQYKQLNGVTSSEPAVNGDY